MTKRNKRKIYILGIHDNHCATAALSKNGKIIAAVSEERFTRFKNQFGFPYRSVKYCLETAKITGSDINQLIFTASNLPAFVARSLVEKSDKSSFLSRLLQTIKKINYQLDELSFFLEYKMPYLPNLKRLAIAPLYQLVTCHLQNKLNQLIWEKFGIARKKIVRMDHHLAHAYAALYSSPFPSQKKDVLIFTCDAVGDDFSATICVYKNGKLSRVVTNSYRHSLGYFYAFITMHLGMKILEHEYKVMGLAPYAPESGKQQAYQILQPLINLDKETLTFKTKINSELFGLYMQKHLQKIRFDYIAAAAQQITEEVLTAWVNEAVRRYKINTIACGGGVFMNVKANQKITELPQIKEAFFMPSAGDESNAIGAAFWGYQQLTGKIPQPLHHLYLGPTYTQAEIERAFNISKMRSKYQVKIYPDIEKQVAYLLANGKIVARFADHMEWGARALGNRSILADASNIEVKEVINKMIKARDFWMPFAPVTLKEDQERYLINPKKITASYMTITFASTKKAQEDLKATLHPYDKTLRPQVIDQKTNPSYYQILTEFKKLTGRSGLLNTSFNIHGEPIVCTPADALSTFVRSGLKFLVIENYLISKI